MPLEQQQAWGINYLSRKTGLATVTVKNVFILSSLHIPWCCFMLFPCILWSVPRKQRLAPPSVLLHLGKLQRAMRPPLSLLFSRLDNPGVLRLSSQDIPSSLFTSFAAFKDLNIYLFIYFNILDIWTAYNIPGEVTPVQNIVEEPPLLTGWQFCVHCTPKCCLPFWLPSHTASLCETACHHHPQVPFWWAAPQQLISKTVPVSNITPSQVQNRAFSFVELHTVDDCSMPLKGLTFLQWVNSTS